MIEQLKMREYSAHTDFLFNCYVLVFFISTLPPSLTSCILNVVDFFQDAVDMTSSTIGVGRFRILGGPRGGGGANSQQAHDVVMASMRRRYVASTSFRCHVLTRFLINQCQIITILILKSDIIENSRIELREIVMPVPSNQIKVTFIIILPFNLVHLWFFPVSHRNWRKRRVDYWGGQRVCWPPLPNYWGAWPPWPPSSYAYVNNRSTWITVPVFMYTNALEK